jgi:cytoskeletal protein CcmA (bactofilin family)
MHGEVVSNISATERVELKGARITGDIEAPVIVMRRAVPRRSVSHVQDAGR